jgi:tetratricopeptide (TPR) repeat protein
MGGAGSSGWRYNRNGMFRYLWLAWMASTAVAAAPVYELSGTILPRGGATVSLFGTDAPFVASTFVFAGSRFHFKKLRPGAYTLSVFMRRRGEARQTIEIGPSNADRRGRVSLQLELKESDFVLASVLRGHTVSAKELAISPQALRDYRKAQQDLSRRDADSAVKRLDDAVERAPQFAKAWNTLGVIAYQRKQYDRAEEDFRQALEQDPQSFEALVNLGGVLVTEHKVDEALTYNERAATVQPNDPLAQSQLGMSYYYAANFELATRHLELARSLDPAHFSYPQLLLAEIHLREGNRPAAADAMADFLEHHPVWPQAALMRRKIAELRTP